VTYNPSPSLKRERYWYWGGQVILLRYITVAG